MTVLISGGGIAGLTLALTCHQVGVPVQVFESARDLRPLGVGINLQPNAVRELFDLGLEEDLDNIGIPTQEWALVGRNGNDIWSEPRGRLAGYNWPQYSVHRGELQMLLYRTVVDRLGPDAVLTGHRVTAWENHGDAVAIEVDNKHTHNAARFTGDLLIGACGVRSSVRAQMHPNEGDPLWGGAVLWRGTTLAPPIRTGASFLLVGSLDQRFVHYPISAPDPDTGLQVQNWIAEITYDPTGGWRQSDWNRRADIDDFLPQFADWNFDWLDIPELVRGADAVYEYPMVDRDPIGHWVVDRVGLIGDAAHVMYPVGSNGASQAIVDARILGAKFLEDGVGPTALATFESDLIDDMSALVLRNRGAGPVAILGTVDDRCGGVFDDIEDVIPRAEIEASMAHYKAAAGFAIETLNAAPPTIATRVITSPTALQ